MTVLAAGVSTHAVQLESGKKYAFAGTLTGTATLTPEMSMDGGTTWDGIAEVDDPTTALAYTATFPTITIEGPESYPGRPVQFRLRNSAGAGSWAVRGF